MRQENKNNPQGYVILIALIIMGLLGFVFLSSLNVLSSAWNYLEILKIENNLKQNNSLNTNLAHKISDNYNDASSTNNQTISCNWDIRINSDDSVTCLSIWWATPPPAVNVDYTLDNNDYKCSYTNDYSKIDALSSKTCDNDDVHRRKITWIITKDELKIVFFSNDKALEIIENNSNNAWANIPIKLPKTWATFNDYQININIKSGSENDLNMVLYTIDKVKFNLNWEIKILSKQITKNWIESVVFDNETKDYYLKFENTWNNIVYEITATDVDNTKPVYINPIDDSDTNNQKILTANFINLGGEFIYFQEEKAYAKSN